jgi:hypothetical protein
MAATYDSEGNYTGDDGLDERDDEANGGLTSDTYAGGVYTDPDTGETINFNDLFSPTGGNTDFGKSLASIKNLLNGKSSFGMAGQLAGLGGIGALLNKMMGSGSTGPSGYQGGIPKYTGYREQYPIPPSGSQSAIKPPEFERPNYDAVMAKMGGSPQRMAGIGALSTSQMQPSYQTPAMPAPRRPGSGGVTYFSPMQYLKPGESPVVSNSQPTIQPYNTGNTPALARDPIPSWMNNPAIQELVATQKPQASVGNDVDLTMPIPQTFSRQNIGMADLMQKQPALTQQLPPKEGQGKTWDYAAGGITTLGGYSDGGQLLRGPGDGVSDDIPATIGNKQPARLADGEFVIPARIVSELGNGSTDAGARKLYAMMDRIKKTRSKAKNIAANTKADKHLPV